MTRADDLVERLAALDPAGSPERTSADHAGQERIRLRIAKTARIPASTTTAHRRLTTARISAGVTVVALAVVAALIVMPGSASRPPGTAANGVSTEAARPPVSPAHAHVLRRRGSATRAPTQLPAQGRRQPSTQAGTAARQAPLSNAPAPAPAPRSQHTTTTGPVVGQNGSSPNPTTHPRTTTSPQGTTTSPNTQAAPPTTTPRPSPAPGPVFSAVPTSPTSGPTSGKRHHAHRHHGHR